MKKKILEVAKILFFLAVGILLFYWIYKDQWHYSLSYDAAIELEETLPQNIMMAIDSIQDYSFPEKSGLKEELSQRLGKAATKKYLPLIKPHLVKNYEKLKIAVAKADFRWIWLSLFIGLLSHISRAMRWNLMIYPLGYKPRLLNTFFAVMAMYLINLAVPRLGEISRCGILRKYEKVPFSKLFGTVFLERIVDFILLVLLLFVVLLLEFEEITEFIHGNLLLKVSKFSISSNTIIVLGGLALFGIFIALYLRKRFRETSLYKKVKNLILDFFEGIKTIRRMDNKIAFIGHSLFIYLMYFLMMYVCVFAFEETAHLGPIEGLAIFVLASFGMVAPVQGGIGAWHFMAIGTLFVFGIPNTPAKAFALIVHGTMNLMLVVVGFISLMILPRYNKSIQKGG